MKANSKVNITFTFGDTVKITLKEDDIGFYIYSSNNSAASWVKFFSVNDAILFFSEFLPVNTYDADENSLTFAINVNYKDSYIKFFMEDTDKTKIAWTDDNPDIKGFNDFWSREREIEDLIDDVIRYFTIFVDEKEKESSTITLTYYYFTSKVYWDSNKRWWYISHILDNADKDILKEDAIIGKDIQELQAKFEQYIDKYLKNK